MAFHEQVDIRKLPFHRSDIIKSVYEQLENGCIFYVPLLGQFNHTKGILFETRRAISYSDYSSAYKVSNDERRRLMKEIRKYQTEIDPTNGWNTDLFAKVMKQLKDN